MTQEFAFKNSSKVYTWTTLADTDPEEYIL